jgi:hypothetical protein
MGKAELIGLFVEPDAKDTPDPHGGFQDRVGQITMRAVIWVAVSVLGV